MSHYFNVTLKSSLGYREEYSSPTYNPYEGVIKFKKVSVDQPEDLKDVLVSDRDIVSQLKDNLITVLSPYFDNLQDISLIFDEFGFGIEILRGKFTDLNLDPYVDIAVNFNKIEELNDFCRSAGGIRDICKTKEFWRSLITRVHPKTYTKNYNYERVYKEYLLYNFYKRNPTDDYINYEQLKDYIDFTMNEGIKLIENDNNDDTLIIISIELGNQKLFDMLNDTYEKSTTGLEYVWRTAYKSFLTSLSEDNSKYAVNYLRMLPLNDKYAKFIDIGDIIRNLYDYEMQWNIKLWRSIYIVLKEYVDTHPLNRIGQANRIARAFNAYVIRKAILNDNENLLEEVLRISNWSILSMDQNIKEYIEQKKRLPPKEIWNVLKKYLSPEAYDVIINSNKI